MEAIEWFKLGEQVVEKTEMRNESAPGIRDLKVGRSSVLVQALMV